jgi:hypothetical protein
LPRLAGRRGLAALGDRTAARQKHASQQDAPPCNATPAAQRWISTSICHRSRSFARPLDLRLTVKSRIPYEVFGFLRRGVKSQFRFGLSASHLLE